MSSKKLHLTRIVALLMLPLLLASCDTLSDFGNTNENPVQPTELDPKFLFPKVQLETPGGWAVMNRANHRMAGAAVQHWASPSRFWVGNTYDRRGGGGTEWSAQHYWGRVFGDQFKNLQHAINFLKKAKKAGKQVDPKLAQARIWEVYCFQLLTDMFGQVPFTDAGQGALRQEFDPEFNEQSVVYDSLFIQLEQAVAQLDGPGSGFGAQDLLTYKGDIAKWKKFANSLRLRLAMRLVKVAPDQAQQQAQAAINGNGGLMQGIDDTAMYFHQDFPNRSRFNPNTYALKQSEMGYPSQTLVRWLKKRKDPRLPVYAAVVQNGEALEVDTSNMKGMPNGFPADRLAEHSSWTEHCGADGESNCTINDYVQTAPELLDQSDPLFHLTYAQVQFMLAEAQVRWGIAPRSAEAHYEEGVRAAMKQLADYGPNAVIPDAKITEYLNENPFKSGASQEEKLEQINEQYWAETFMNGIEGWINWRRSGYPDLEPAPVGGTFSGPGGGLPENDTNGQIPRRFIYHRDEVQLNTENMQEVFNEQGPNEMMTRVWWDVKQ